MKKPFLPLILPLIALLAGAAALYFLYIEKAPPAMEQRIPGTDETPTSQGGVKPEVKGLLERGPGAPSTDTGAWTGFLGNKRDNISPEKGFKKSFGKDGPEVLWRVKTGEGYAGAAVLGGRVFFIDYDQEKKRDAIRCLSLADGREIWRFSYGVKVKRNHGMSRTTPAVTDKYLVTIGPMCHTTCLNSNTGELIWKKDLVSEFGTSVPPWYAGQCPLIDNGLLILAPGGKNVLMAAIDLASGNVKWSVKNPGGFEMTHSSVMPLNFKGKKYYLYCASGGAVLVSAAGDLQFVDPAWKINIANVPSPVYAGEGLVLFTGGYDTGSKLIKLKEEGGKVGFSEVWKLLPRVFGSQQATPAFYNGYFYGVIQAGNLVCLDLSGKQAWKSDKRFGLGPFVIAGGLIYVIDDMQGIVYIVEAAPDAYRELAAAKVFNGQEIWSPIAVASGKMIAKDLTEMVCFKVN